MCNFSLEYPYPVKLTRDGNQENDPVTGYYICLAKHWYETQRSLNLWLLSRAQISLCLKLKSAWPLGHTRSVLETTLAQNTKPVLQWLDYNWKALLAKSGNKLTGFHWEDEELLSQLLLCLRFTNLICGRASSIYYQYFTVRYVFFRRWNISGTRFFQCSWAVQRVQEMWRPWKNFSIR